MSQLFPYPELILRPVKKKYISNVTTVTLGSAYTMTQEEGTSRKIYQATLQFNNLEATVFNIILSFFYEHGSGRPFQLLMPDTNELELFNVVPSSVNVSSVRKRDLSVQVIKTYA